MGQDCAQCAGNGKVVVGFDDFEGKPKTDLVLCGICRGKPLSARLVTTEGDCQACAGRGVRRPHLMAETCSGPLVPILGPEEPCAACCGTGKCAHCIPQEDKPLGSIPALVAEDDGVWAVADLCPYCCV